MPDSLTDWQVKTRDGVQYFEYSPNPRLLLVFLTRRGGVSSGAYESLNTSFQVGDDASLVEENLALARLALRLPDVLAVKQTHSDEVLDIADEHPTPESLQGDACITDRVGLGLGLKVADCLPVYIYSSSSKHVGIAHCGWRGTAARLAEKTARQMSSRFSIPLPDLRFALGPCICPDCYEVGDDVRTEFSRNFPDADRFLWPAGPDRGKGKHLLDLRAANRWLLSLMGLTETKSLNFCTRENEWLFYSARRNQTTGRNLALIALR